MLNPNEIAAKRFDKAMGRGYKIDEVESFLNQVAGDMEDLMMDKQELEQKLMVLADKLEEYKRDEESLRSALLGAQKLGDSVIREAKAKAVAMAEEANAKADMMIDNAKKEIERQQNGFVRMQREVATFKSKLQLVYKQHLELISSIPVDESVVNPPKAPVAPPEPEPAVEEISEEVYEEQLSADYAEPLGMDMQDQGDEYAIPYADAGGEAIGYDEAKLEYSSEDDYLPEPEKPLKHESRFGPLKFGKEFDIKRENEKRKK